MATGFVQVALEQAPNAEGGANAVSSNVFYLPASQFTFDENPELLEYADELRGGFFRAPHGGASAYDPNGAFDVRCYPATLGFLLYQLCGSCVTTAGNGSSVTDPDSAAVPVGAYRHVFSFKTADPPQTAQYIYSPPAGGFYKAQGVAIDECEFKVANGAWQAAAKLLGLYHSTISDPSLTPSYETAKPWLSGQLALSWLSGSATTREFDWKIQLGCAAERQFTTASLYPDSMVFDENLPVLGGSIPKRAFDSDDWAALIGGTTFAAEIKMTHSDNAVGSYKHKLWVEMPACQYVAGKADPVENKRRREASFDWEARYDTATSSTVTITLVNSTAAYATFA